MAPKKKATADADDVPADKKTKTGLAVGDLCPDFELETDESTADEPHMVKLKDIVADHGAVIFFYPQANTGGCTTQACGFRDNYEKLVETGYKVYGMSADKPPAQKRWKEKHSFQYPLLSDPSREVLKALGVHKAPKSINRSHIIIEKGGKVLAVEYGVKPKDSVAAVVAFVDGTEEVNSKAAEP